MLRRYILPFCFGAVFEVPLLLKFLLSLLMLKVDPSWSRVLDSVVWFAVMLAAIEIIAYIVAEDKLNLFGVRR